jgi:hypothetical protein
LTVKVDAAGDKLSASERHFAAGEPGTCETPAVKYGTGEVEVVAMPPHHLPGQRVRAVGTVSRHGQSAQYQVGEDRQHDRADHGDKDHQ